MTPKELNSLIKKKENRYIKQNNSFTCKSCQSEIMAIQVPFSIHDGWSIFQTHAGGGEVRRYPIPYCPKCEGEPTTFGFCLDI